jgi:hypothetical protein
VQRACGRCAKTYKRCGREIRRCNESVATTSGQGVFTKERQKSAFEREVFTDFTANSFTQTGVLATPAQRLKDGSPFTQRRNAPGD